MSIEQKLFLIKELQIQQAWKRRKVEKLTKEVVVLSATIQLLTTVEVRSYGPYFFRHQDSKLPPPSTSGISRIIVPLTGADITLITDVDAVESTSNNPNEHRIVAVALQQDIVSHPLGTIAHPDSDEEEEYSEDLGS